MPHDAAALPKHVQTSEMLIREIAAGRLADGERLPPERHMAAGLGIAVGTLRKALSELQGRGLLERRQGSGNYIRHRAEAAGLYAFFRLELPEGGGLPTAALLGLARMPKPDTLPPFGTSRDAFRIRRLRRLSGVPVALEEIWLDATWAPELRPEMLSESLYLFYRKALGLWIARAEDRVGTGRLPGWGPPEFPLAAGAVTGFVERRGATVGGETAEFSRTWFDPDRSRYVCRMK